MNASGTARCHPLGTHRVLEPAGAMPQQAWRLDNTPCAQENEILCDVEALNIDSASFKQIVEACGNDARRVADHVASNVRARGKQHNAVTGSGGMFVGRVAEIGTQLRDAIDLQPGDRIASLVSLTLTPLHIDEILDVDIPRARIVLRGKAILFSNSPWVRLPKDIDDGVALAALDVAGAPAQVRRLCTEGQTVVIIGADGKSGLLSCAQAMERVGAAGRVIGVVPDGATAGAHLLRSSALVHELVIGDARDTLGTSAAVIDAGGVADVVVNCVNVAGTELTSILCTRSGGTVYFFSMATSFTAAALGAEGAGRDVTMIIGNGYAHGHADIALQTLRDHPELHRYFKHAYARTSP